MFSSLVPVDFFKLQCENELHYVIVIASDVHIPLYRSTCVELNASTCLYELSSEVKPNAYEGLLK